jgi:hypothetical protein
MRFQCSYHDAKGTPCENEATYRLHYAKDHPFNHVDTCTEHLDQYFSFAWMQDLGQLNAEKGFK